MSQQIITDAPGEKEAYAQLQKVLDLKGISVGELLKRAAEKYADDEALISQGTRVTYKEFYFRSVLLSKKLRERGVRKGDRVCLSSENSIDYYIAYFAIWQIGAVSVPLNTFLHPREIGLILTDAAPKAIIASKALVKNFETVVSSGFTQELPPLLTTADIDWETTVPHTVAEISQDFTISSLPSDELCLLLYTSGTTGMPKGVMLSSHNIMTNCLQSVTRMALSVLEGQDSIFGERFFAALPLFHVFAQNTCIWTPILLGGAVIIVPKIDRKDIMTGLKEKPTLFFGVPALYGLLALMKTAPLDSVRLFISGGDALPDKIRSVFGLVYGRKICCGYGLTEAAPIIAVNMENKEKPTHIVGKPVIDVECEIRDIEGVVQRPGNIGTLWVRGDNVMLGYYNAPKATAEVLQDGWLNTGDLAAFDDEGYLSIRGRHKDLIIHKGINIYPQEIENILLTHPAVFKAAVIGKEDDLSGQVPVAYVAMKNIDAQTEQKLRAFCVDHLAAYKVPRKIICVDDLPLGPTGKIDKKVLDKQERVS